MRPLADYHTHTRWSHASGSIEDNLRAAEEMGLRELGIAEHGPNLLFVGVPRRRWFRLRRAVAATPGINTRLLFNIEANIISLDGELDIPSEVVEALDMVLVGLHPRIVPRGLPDWWAYYPRRYMALFSRRQRHLLYDSFTQAVVRCVERNPVDIVVHPGYGLPIDSRELARACARRGTRMEINCRHTAESAGDIQRAAQIPELEFVIGSDAHSPQAVGKFEAGFRLVQGLGIERERVVNVDWQDNSH